VQSHPENIEAYDLYLRGRFHWNRMTPDGYAKAIECFEGAIQIDPTYAPAYAGMASAHAYSIHIEGREAAAIAAKGKAAALKAIELDERLPEAHAALGYILFAHYWDWPVAEAAFDRAVQANPNSAYAHYLYSIYFGNLGRYDEAIRESELSVDLDPLWPQAAQNLGWWYIHARRFAEGEMFLRRSLEMQPDFPLGRINLGLYLLSDRPEEGIKELELASTASGDAPIARCLLAYAYATNSQTDRAREILLELSALAEEQYVSDVFFSIVHIGLGEYDEALVWIERGYEARVGQMVWCPSLFVFDPLREDARFVGLMRKMGL
jgi:tetratricopeptide (TPR) repeat protein